MAPEISQSIEDEGDAGIWGDNGGEGEMRSHFSVEQLITHFQQNLANYIMQNLTNFPNLIDRWLRYRFQTILVVCFLLWTPFLVAETLQVQHSCHPMIHWSGTLPAECQAKVSQTNSSSSKKPETQRDRSQEQIAQNEHRPSPKPSPTSQEQKQIAQRDRSPSPKPQTSEESPPPQQTEKPNPIEEVIKTAKDNPDIAGGVIAIGVASIVAVVASAPLVLAAGIGAAVWFAIRTVL